MDNYQFCVWWVTSHHPSPVSRVLDYGCGAGQIVKELRKRHIHAYGCDLFYEGGDYKSAIDPGLLSAGVIREMRGNEIPFGTETFDFVVNNQVMEHVEDLDAVLMEISRVLKPGGVVLSIFPDRSVWREGHCGIPFLHWFPKNSRLRVFYAATLRAVGFGYHKGEKGILEWSKDFCDWLDQWTHYRKREDVLGVYQKYFCDLQDLEDVWLQQRLGKMGGLVAWLPVCMQQYLVRKLWGVVFVARKAA